MKNITTYIVPLTEIKKGTTKWVVPHWIPRGGITLLAGDGGVGKTSLWCKLLADMSNAIETILEDPLREEDEGELELSDDPNRPLPNKTCMYFSAEDSTSRRLKDLLERYGATQEKILTAELENLGSLRYNSPELPAIIEEYRPEICVFDPIQAFMPRGSAMSSRQDSREALNHLVRMGNRYGTAFLLVCHTNKKKTDDWRQRLSGSADLPDIARSVIFTDYTHLMPGKTIRFISNEKNSYHELEQTVLYRFENGLLTYAGISDRRFAEFARDGGEYAAPQVKQTQKESCREAIKELLNQTEQMQVRELDELLQQKGFGKKAITIAKGELEEEGEILRWKIYEGSRPVWFVKCTEEDFSPETPCTEGAEQVEQVE